MVSAHIHHVMYMDVTRGEVTSPIGPLRPTLSRHAVAPTPYDAAFVGLRTEWVVYGRPAAEVLRAEIAGAKNGDPLAPVTVIVPSNHVGVAARRLLASGRIGSVCGQGKGVAAVTFLTVYRLGELLGGSPLGRGRSPSRVHPGHRGGIPERTRRTAGRVPPGRHPPGHRDGARLGLP